METKESTIKNPAEALFEEALLKVEKIEVGKVLKGTVIALKKNEILVDLGGRATGVVLRRELGEKASVLDLQKGDEVLTYVMEEEDEHGFLTLSLKKAGKERIWLELEKKKEKGDLLEARINDANKGGLLTSVEGIQGFIPVSQLTAEYYPRVEGGDKEEILTRLISLVDKTLQVKVIDIDRATNKLILSQKAAKSEEQKDFLGGLKVGQKLKGTVSGVVDFGVFVNIGEIEGLVHISEVSWERIDDIKKIVKVGDEIDVIISEIEEDKVSLSMKRLLSDPFKEAIKQFKEGDMVTGKVIRVTPFGAFVQVATPDKKHTIDGLVHISELSEEHVLNPKEYITEKETYELKIISIEEENRKLSLSLKEAGNQKVKEKPVKKETKAKAKKETKEEKPEKKEKAKKSEKEKE